MNEVLVAWQKKVGVLMYPVSAARCVSALFFVRATIIGVGGRGRAGAWSTLSGVLELRRRGLLRLREPGDPSPARGVTGV